MKKKIRKLINGSGKALCAICKEPHLLVVHHIRGRDIPNANDNSNLASICSNCHLRVHNGDVVVEGWFSTTDGLQLFWHLKSDESFSGNDAVPHIIKRGKHEV